LATFGGPRTPQPRWNEPTNIPGEDNLSRPGEAMKAAAFFDLKSREARVLLRGRRTCSAASRRESVRLTARRCCSPSHRAPSKDISSVLRHRVIASVWGQCSAFCDQSTPCGGAPTTRVAATAAARSAPHQPDLGMAGKDAAGRRRCRAVISHHHNAPEDTARGVSPISARVRPRIDAGHAGGDYRLARDPR